jgi:hypothetical protein
MNMDYSDIKSDIIDHWEQLSEMAYPEDLLTELADSACPVYYSGILQDWSEMPNNFTDSWQEFQEFIELTQETTIFSLMSADLFNYYSDRYRDIFAEVRHDKEQESEELENA